MLVDVEKLDAEQRRRILKKLTEKLGLAYASRALGVSRSTLYRYLNKNQNVLLGILSKAAEMLALDKLSDAIYGLKVVEIDTTTALSVVVKAVKDEKFRNFFMTQYYSSTWWSTLRVPLRLTS
jgi:transcriptional regulator with XRE-family HTH domain